MSVIMAQRSIKHYDKQWFVVHMEKQIKMRTRCKQAVYSKVMLILFEKLSDKRFIVSCETRLIVRLMENKFGTECGSEIIYNDALLEI